MREIIRRAARHERRAGRGRQFDPAHDVGCTRHGQGGFILFPMSAVQFEDDHIHIDSAAWIHADRGGTVHLEEVR